MKKNIIQVLKSGNQELFYSSFLAWLLDSSGDHGLADQFSKWFLNRIEIPFSQFKVSTETAHLCGRIDILLDFNDGSQIAIENKTKSIGSEEQLEAYETSFKKLVLIGLVPENFPPSKRSDVISYNEIRIALLSMKRNTGSLSILVEHFLDYLEHLLLPFELISKIGEGKISIDSAKNEFLRHKEIFENENDQRFFQCVYFEKLRTYLSENRRDLVFGNTGYLEKNQLKDGSHGTRWIIEKDRQGPAFMEAIIYKTDIPGKITMQKKWKALFERIEEPDISPRIELWMGPKDFLKEERLGMFQLGCWNPIMRKAFSDSKEFNKRGPRNFHFRNIFVNDLKFERMASLILEEMRRIWIFEELA
jgi:hypothetical protein